MYESHSHYLMSPFYWSQTSVYLLSPRSHFSLLRTHSDRTKERVREWISISERERERQRKMGERSDQVILKRLIQMSKNSKGLRIPTQTITTTKCTNDIDTRMQTYKITFLVENAEHRKCIPPTGSLRIKQSNTATLFTPAQRTSHGFNWEAGLHRCFVQSCI